MNPIDDVRRENTDLARVLRKNPGIRRIVEDLYPDSAHFIYELLQNAEDTGATEGCFILSKGNLVFEHNGRSFNQKDLFDITKIGEGSKAGDDEKIGRFGLGFKAVFAYSETPRIWSPPFPPFEISELVLPSKLKPLPDLHKRTRFEFPFNNPKKLPDTAFAEIYAGLTGITETTLLFLTHLELIGWIIEGGSFAEVRRIQHSDYHFEVLKEVDGKTTTSSHFLKFERPVEGSEKHRVAVAFALDVLPNIQQFNPGKAISKQLRIVPAAPGRVAVFFPAEKETSGLRFHLHAPFVPELSRASIKESPANQPLFAQLATLTAEALHQIRDLGLLTMEFLGVLPNPQDPIPSRYQSIRDAVFEAMNDQPLTPTHARTHAPARRLVQGKAVLKDLLSEKDLEFLIDYEPLTRKEAVARRNEQIVAAALQIFLDKDVPKGLLSENMPEFPAKYEDGPRQWAMAASQKNSNADRFLSCLAITEWDVNEFIELLQQKTRTSSYAAPDKIFMKWLANKSFGWHQEFYAFLYKELETKEKLHLVRELNIVRLGNGSYCFGAKCYFPGKGDENDDMLPRVDVGVYTSGKNKTQQENARKLLEAIGVREVGEAEQIEAILKQRYTKKCVNVPNEKTNRKDLQSFIALVEKEPGKAEMFSSYFIFQGADHGWHKPNDVFLDLPFKNTGLSAWHGALSEKEELNAWYRAGKIKAERIAKFAEAVGAQTHLKIEETDCYDNPHKDHLLSVRGPRQKPFVNKDFRIPFLEDLLGQPSLALSKLVWETMRTLQTDCLYATFQRNRFCGSHKAPSQLAHCLQNVAWIPQGRGKRLVFVRPAEAFPDKLPEGFPFDSGWKWLKAIHFGQELTMRSEEQVKKQEMAKELGFADNESLVRAQRFASLPPDEQERLLADQERRRFTKLSEHELANPDLRIARVREQAAEAPERQTEQRTRSVSVEREAVKKETIPYLCQQYTNSDGEMICQICQTALPFKLPDGSYYFVAIEFLPELRKRHKHNYLALCPNHAAMFKHANSSQKQMMDMFLENKGTDLKLILADQDMSIYFTRTHITDLRTVIEVDQKEEGDK